MNTKTSVTENLLGAKSCRSCLRLLIALAILCWGSMVHAQQSETWMGTNSTGPTPYVWTNILNWVDNTTGANERPTSLGDNLTFGGKGSVLVVAAAKSPTNNYPFLSAANIIATNQGLPFFNYTNTFATNAFYYNTAGLASNVFYFATNVVNTNAPLSAWTTNRLTLTNGLGSATTNISFITNTIASFTNVYIYQPFANTNNLVINSITFTTNGFILSGNSLTISNGITDNAGLNTNAIPMIIGNSQTFQNNSHVIGTNANYFTNTESAGINLGTNTLTIGGSAPLFLTSITSSTNGGMLIINNSSVARLSVTNAFGTNVVQITNYFSGAGTFAPAITNYYTNSYVIAGVSTNYFVFSSVVAAVTNGSYVYATNTFGPQNPDALIVQGGGVAQLNPVIIGNNGGSQLLPNGTNVGNISLDGTLDLNGQNPTINGLEDSGGYSGVVDNLSTNNIGLYTFTVGNANSNGVFTGTIGSAANLNNPGATAGTIGLTKVGYGTETLQAANQYAGPTIINQGKLVVASGASLGTFSQNLNIAAGAVLDVSGLAPFFYQPVGPLTITAGTPTKPYTNFLGSYDPYWPTYSVSNSGTNNVITYVTNTDLATYTNIVATTNIVSYSYSTNSIISIITADVYGNLWVPGGGAISPETVFSPGVATWAIQGNLTMDNALSLSVPLNKNRVNFLLNSTTTPGGGTNDLIAVSGTLKIGDELDFVITPLTATLAAGKYTLITSSHYTPETGTHAPVFRAVLERGLQGDTVTVDPLNPNNIVFNSIGGAAAPGSVIWAGTPALNNWDVALTGNWRTNGTTYPNPDFFYPGDNVTFNDNGVGTIVLPVVVQPGSMIFNNSLTNYTFTQSQSTFITGVGGLTKNGSGSVTLQNPNSFTGDITVNGGTLNLGFAGGSTPPLYVGQRVVYNGVPAGNLVLGGGTINLNELVNVTPEADFNNLTINPGASSMTQTARTAQSTPTYVISNNVFRAVGGVLNLVLQVSVNPPPGPDNGGHCGMFFTSTSSPGGTNYYGVNGILGGYATISLNDWVWANNTFVPGTTNYTGYQTDINPANWGANSNLLVSASLSGNVNTMTINSLKLDPAASHTVNINPNQTLTLSSGGLLVPTATAPSQVAVAGGTLLGAPGADLILLNNNITPGSSLLINSVIANNGGATALTTAGGGTTILTGNNIYTGTTYIENGINGAPSGTLQVGSGGTSGSITTSTAIIDNGTLAFYRSDNINNAVAISGTGGLTKQGSGALTLTANNSLSGLVTIGAGTLQLGTGGPAGSVSNATAIVDNGTLVFDNNNTVGYANPISGYGGLVQFGTGNLIIATNEIYSGNTVVSNGVVTLTASGSISNTASITVNTGALLDVSAVSGGLALRSAAPPEVLQGSGTVNGSVTTATGTTLEPTPSTGAYGTLTISGTLNMAGGNFRFDVGNGNNNHDLVNVGGTLIMNSGTVIINVTGGSLANNVYPLIHASGGIIGAAANLGVFGFNQPGQIAVLIIDAPNNNLDLLVYSGSITALTWVGDGSANVWDVNATANWNNGSGPVPFANPDYTVIDDTGSASPAINITAQVSPTGVTNNAITKNYVLGANTGSAGKITGGASLVQNSAGQLTLQTLNDYLGGTQIKAGTVQLGNNTAAAEDGMVGGSGAVAIGASGTLVVSNFATETMSGSLSGSGQLVQAGVGKLVLAGNNTAFVGTINATNFLQMGNGFAGTLGTGTVTNNRTLLLNVGPTPLSTVVVAANIGGSGNVTNIGPGIVTLTGNNTWAGNTAIPEGTIRLGSGTGLPSTTALYMDNNNSPGLTGTLDLNGNNATVASMQGTNAGQGNLTLVESMIVNNGTGTATLTVGSGLTNTFNGEILDNNNGSTGKVALLVTNNTALTLNACYNSLGINTYPNLFSGGITVSNSLLYVGFNNGSTTPANEAGASAGVGPITLEGGLGTITNGMTRMPSNSVMFACGAYNSSSPTLNGTLLGPVNVPAGQFGTLFLPQRGTFSCTLTGAGTLIVEPNYVRGEQGGDWSTFTGTIIFESIVYTGSSGSGWSINSPNGYPNATLYMQTLNSAGNVNISGANGGYVFPIGALTGGDSSSLIGGGSQGNGASGGAANTIWAIGGLGLSTTNGSQIVDAGCGLRVVGGSLTLTNNNMTFGGQLVVSNGTLAFAPVNITNTFDYPATASYLNGTNITIVGSGVLDMTAASTNSELYVGHNAAQTLFGNGTIKGNLWVTNSTVAPGRRASNPNTYPGSLKVTGAAAINIGSTLVMSINSTTSPTYDSLTATGGLTINSARLTVVNSGPAAFPPGTTNVFQFFQGAVPVNIGGSTGITNITLPALAAGEYWITNLTVNGSMVLVDTNVVTLNAAAPPMQVKVVGNQLTLGWPTNLGWILQSQTNGSGVGLTPATNWVDVAGSATQTNVVITLNPTNPAVFYRLRNPTAPPQ